MGYRQFNFIEIPGARHGNLADYKEYDEMFDKALN
jgi:hypothetical protein